MTIRDEFIDVYEMDELRNRFKNECLPLPVLCAFQDADKKNKIIQLLEKEKITEEEAERTLNLVINAESNRKLGKELRVFMDEAIRSLRHINKNKDLFVLLLKSAVEDLPH